MPDDENQNEIEIAGLRKLLERKNKALEIAKEWLKINGLEESLQKIEDIEEGKND